jgi:NAD(P)-dependent dehydrogenase (short-subunit alcohol dehydrogenase family)
VSKRLEESAVVIVGGTSGVGLASARAFAAAGVPSLLLVGRNTERGELARKSVANAFPGTHVLYHQADVNDPRQAEATAFAAWDQLGNLDVLVNSTAAAYMPTLLKDADIDEIEAGLVQQALGPMLMSRAVLRFMVPQGSGVILNIASDAAKVPTPGESVIGAAMAAIVTFSQTLAVEAKRDGIRVNVLTPSLIEGTITGDRALSGGFSKKLFEKARQQAHLGVAVPEDLAELIVFLAGPGAARITGQVISVNGGISVA